MVNLSMVNLVFDEIGKLETLLFIITLVSIGEVVGEEEECG